MSKWFVSRQAQYYHEGRKVVEIEKNGLDHAGPGMYTPAYSDEEGQEYDPRTAVDVAIRLRDAWKKDDPEVAGITLGSTFGGSFEPELFEGTDEELRAEGEKAYEAIPKCDHCGEFLEERFTSTLHGPDFGTFCSTYCCETAVEEDRKLNEEDD